MKAGSLLVWNDLLPHCNTNNHTSRWRYCQYIRMFPAAKESEIPVDQEEAETIELGTVVRQCYLTGERPPYFSTDVGGHAPPKRDPNLEVDVYVCPPLSSLGRKLVNIDSWFS